MSKRQIIIFVKEFWGDISRSSKHVLNKVVLIMYIFTKMYIIEAEIFLKKSKIRGPVRGGSRGSIDPPGILKIA